MERYRFLGSTLCLPEHELSVFGQAVDLDPSFAIEIIARNAALLPEGLWNQTGLTEAECQEYPSTELHKEAPPEFVAKRDAAWRLLHEYRTSLSARSANPPAPAEKEA